MPKPHGPIAIDAEDATMFMSRTWSRHRLGYAVTSESRTIARAGGRRSPRVLLLHRVLMNAPVGVEVDHVNGDVLDNRRCNLRLCTRAQNARNVSPHVGSASLYKGVSRYRGALPWRARIWCDGKEHTVGYFGSEQEAARAYDAEALRRFGEYARLNFSEAAG